MWNKTDENCGWGGWGFIIFFIFLFYAFSNGNGVFGRGTDANGNGVVPSFDLTSFTQLKDLQCTVGRNDALLDGKLDTGFRAVIDNDNKNTVEIIRGQDMQYIKQLERENAQLFADKTAQETRYLMLAGNAQLERRLDSIECSMLKRPPVYPTTCVPCSTNSFGGGCGSFA